MSRKSLVSLVIASIIVGTFCLSSAALSHFYRREVSATTQTLILENSAKVVKMGNILYRVENVLKQENSYLLSIASCGVSYDNVPPPPAPLAERESPDFALRAPLYFHVEVPTGAYETAEKTGQPVTISRVTTIESKPIDVIPFAAVLSVAVGIAAISIWIGYRQAWGDATSLLIERGLHDLSVRDIELVGYMMQKEEFTIPELMKLTKAPKLKVWRVIQKLVEEGLVEPTDRTRLAANGLGGRGRPSRVYRYIGKKLEPVRQVEEEAGAP